MHGFGNMLRDYLEYYKISQSDFADRLGITQKHMNEIINGKTRLTTELIVSISILTDIDANLIYFIEKKKDTYDELIEKYKNKRNINKMLNSFHLTELVNKKWLKLKDSVEFTQNYLDLVDFMGLKDASLIDNYLNKRYLFKKSDKNADNIKIFLWTRHCDLITKGIEICEYDSSKLNNLLDELKLERMKEFNKDSLISLFKKYGIILCVEDALKGSKVRGCVKVMINTPAIYMTTYKKEKSSFYYTLYHEIMHLKSDYNKLKSKTMVDDDEKEVDLKALNEMIDEKTYNDILNDYDNKDRIALDNNIPLCFLYSRLAYEGKIKYNSKEYMDHVEKI